MERSILYVCALALLLLYVGGAQGFSTGRHDEPKQKWAYATVRPEAHMFWWLYYTTASEGYQKAPLVIWLQGGPGGSSTGFGNFQEIGPLDVTLKPRNTTWLSQVSLLFIDNPVGTGFSYVDNNSAYATNNSQIAADLVTLMKAFYKTLPDFREVPLYIFSESYGGKMTAGFAQALYKAIQDKELQCNFKGFAMGDSWISPMDSVLTWGPYLYSTSLVDEAGLAAINKYANKTNAAAEAGNWTESTDLWSATENVVEQSTFYANFYNIMKWGGDESVKENILGAKTPFEKLYARHVRVYAFDPLSKLMNGPIRKKLGIIPTYVTWGGQSSQVFLALREDFNKPVIHVVDDLLKNTDLNIVVYNGQLDLIVDTLGTERWVQKLKWGGMSEFYAAERKPLLDAAQLPVAFVKTCKQNSQFSFYWILDAGHMVPQDAGDAALQMLKKITQQD